MKWKVKDIKQYVESKEYIDTAIIPLVPLNFSQDEEMVKLSFQKEVMELYTNHIEQQLKGRVFLFPEYYYMKNDKITNEQPKLEQYIESINHQPFKYIFLITFDRDWRKLIREIDAELLWIPSIKDGDLNQKETQQFIQSQVKEIEQLIMDSWNSN
ncbi:DUF2487 family protein [Bacillaceae bacterium W0354]